MTRQWMGWLAVVAVAACVTVPAGGVTYDWRAGPTVPGVDGYVNACVTWDPDGDGPLGEWLVVAGQFSVAGDIVARNVAAWDGQHWHALGNGLGGEAYGWVYALAVYKDQLYAGQEIISYSPGCSSPVARFNGTDWEPIENGPDYRATALVVYNDELVVAGRDWGIYTSNMDWYDPYHGLGAWDGTHWRPFAATGPGDDNADIESLVVYDGQLIVGGDLAYEDGPMSCLARWDGQRWQALGDGLMEPLTFGWQHVAGMTIHNGELVAAKDYESYSIDGIRDLRGTVARWDGSMWHILRQENNFEPAALTVYRGQLVCSASRRDTGGADVSTWDGSTWQSISTQICGPMCTYNGDLIVGGNVYTLDASSLSVRRWDGHNWHSLGAGPDWSLSRVTTYHGELVLAGTFYTFGQAPYTGFVHEEAGVWTSLTEHLTEGGIASAGIGAMTEFNGDLLVGGWLTDAGGVPCNGIARWDGRQWHALDGGMSIESGEPDVRALLIHEGQLIIGGYFDTAGGVSTCGVARWDGQTWHAMDAGLTGTWYYDPFSTATYYTPPYVCTLASYNGEIIAGGLFATADGIPASIARWDGRQWQPLGTGLTDPSYASVDWLAVYNGQLIVAGYFGLAGGVPCDSLAAWDGSQWHALSGPVRPGEYSHPSITGPLAVYDGRLIVAGPFTPLNPGDTIGEMNAWDGTRWQSMGGTNWGVTAILPYNGELVIVGSFTTADGKVSNGLAYLRSRYPGDLNGDGHVDIRDLLTFADSFGKTLGQDGFDTSCDINRDGRVDILDLLLLAEDWSR